MSYTNFADLISSFCQFDDRLALSIRPFIKVERLSYKDLRAKAYQVSHCLAAEGVTPGDRIMILSGNSPEWVELFFGAQLIGAIIVPVDASSSLKTTKNFIKQTAPKVIFKSRYLYPELRYDGKVHLLEELNEIISSYPIKAPGNKLNGDDPALIVFTSGTTADPKGVVLSQKNVLTNIEGIQSTIAISADWRLLSVLPLSHMYELTGSLAVLSRGASIFYMPRVSPQAIARALQDYQITTILAIPQLTTLLLERVQQVAADEGRAKSLAIAAKLASILPFGARRWLFRSVHTRLGGHLSLVVTGGAPIPIKTAIGWERMGVKMLQGYGLTETSPILTINGLNERRLDSPGRPLSNLRLRIVEDGEIQAKGPSIFMGYWSNSVATRAAYTKDGWFKTGDIGKLENGWLHIQGRLKFAVVLASGLKVFPEDIETVAVKDSVFKEFCIVAVRQPKGESVVAVIISDKSDQMVNQSIAKINRQLESFQHISEWRRWPDSDFPRTRLLKVDRRKVEDWANKSSDDKPKEAESNKTSADQLVSIIQLSLGAPSAKIKESDRLADIGLDSLRRLNVVSLIEAQIGVTIQEEHVRASTTISDLRKLVSQGSKAEPLARRPTWPRKNWVRYLGSGLREIVIDSCVKIWVRIDVEGLEKLNNLTQPALFIFNHTDDFDGPVIYKALPRTIRKSLSVAMADDVMSEHKVLAFVARLCFNGFNFSRVEPYMPSLEYVGAMVDRGWNIVLSPEGRITTSGKLQPFKSGIGLLAVNLGVAVVPIKTIGLMGTVPLHSKWPKRHSHIIVRIGQPMKFGATRDYDEVTQELYDSVENL